MSPPPPSTFLPTLPDREHFFRYLDRRPAFPAGASRAHLPIHSYVSAFLLEWPDAPADPSTMPIPPAGAHLSRVDNALFTLQYQRDPGPWALVEFEDPRFPTIYTTLPAKDATARVHELQSDSPALDRVWFSSTFFRRLWKTITTTVPSHRYSQITFEHDSIYTPPLQLTYSDDEPDDDLQHVHSPHFERRKARMKLSERISDLEQFVLPWESNYNILRSIVHLRVPAERHGGYDVYHNGRFVNRSQSTSQFRELIRELSLSYKKATQHIEDAMWPPLHAPKDSTSATLGRPLHMLFSKELDRPTFSRWTKSFRRKNNRLRFWGNPLSRGATKAHVYAVDSHSWQPIDLELTTKRVTAHLPRGTCGNTIHRLVSHVQQHIDPAVTVFVGDQRFEDLIA